MLSADKRSRLRRVIAVMNRKGGVGKTSITSNLAGVLAQAGYKVLAIDLDQQGNLGDDLGYRHTDYNDHGAALFFALNSGTPLAPAKGIRENLDVVPAGEQTALLADTLTGRQRRNEDPSFGLADKLAEIADQYDIVLIDCPPGDTAIQAQALVAARWILIPTQPDSGSLNGLEQLAREVIATQPKNPTIMPLGAVLFPIDSRAKRMKARKHEEIREIMGDLAPVFTTSIRFSQTSGVDSRDRGQLAIELARDAEEQDPFARAKALKARKAGETVEETPSQRISDSAGSLAEDYVELTGEILQALAAHENSPAGEVA